MMATTPDGSGVTIDPLEQGLLSALACIKIAAQNSPHFDDELLIKAAKFFIAARHPEQNKQAYELPLTMLLADHSNILDHIRQQ
jgi:hypothetical protein